MEEYVGATYILPPRALITREVNLDGWEYESDLGTLEWGRRDREGHGDADNGTELKQYAPNKIMSDLSYLSLSLSEDFLSM